MRGRMLLQEFINLQGLAVAQHSLIQQLRMGHLRRAGCRGIILCGCGRSGRAFGDGCVAVDVHRVTCVCVHTGAGLGCRVVLLYVSTINLHELVCLLLHTVRAQMAGASADGSCVGNYVFAPAP